MEEKLALYGGRPYRTEPFATWPQYDQRDIQTLSEIAASGRWSRSPYTRHLKYTYETESRTGQFEKTFSEFLGVEHGLMVNSGTSALHLIFEALELEAPAEVITTPYTFFSTTAPLFRQGLKPVFVDIDENGNLDPASLEQAVTSRTRAVLIMHCGGYPCDLEIISAVCRKHKLCLIQDCAHAPVSRIGGKHVAEYGDVSMFSFEAYKILTCGEGGFVATGDEALFKKMFSIYSCGRPYGGAWNEHILPSENYRPTEFQAGLALSQFWKLAAQCEARERNRRYLCSRLTGHPLLEPVSPDCSGITHSHYAFLLKLKPETNIRITIKRLLMFLSTEGIPCNAGYNKLIYNLTYSRRFFTEAERRQLDETCACAVWFLENVIWLPQHLFLGSRQDMDDIAGAIEKIHAHLKDKKRN